MVVQKIQTLLLLVGSNKTIIGTTDGGKNWNKHYSSLDSDYLNGITIKNEEIWVVGENGTVVCSRDNGTIWFENTIEGNWLSDICFLSNGVGYIVGSNSGTAAFLNSVDGGKSWALQESFPNYSTIEKIKFSGDSLGWMVSTPGSIMKSTTFGNTWEILIDSIYFINNIAVSGNSAWFTFNNKVLRTTDAGSSWNSFKVFDYNNVIFSGCDIDFLNSRVGYISTYDSRVFKTINGGETWIAENYPKGINNFAIDFVNEEVGWVFSRPGIF